MLIAWRAPEAILVMTPAQLRSYAAVVRCGTVGEAAVDLGVSQAAVSANIAALRRQVNDPLFRRSGCGLTFTAGGHRLAHRAAEILSLQDLTIREIANAHKERAVVRLAATSLFAEYAAPGLLNHFSTQEREVDVELLVTSSDRFHELLETHRIDVAIGPRGSLCSADVVSHGSLSTDILVVGQPHAIHDHDSQKWFVGPSAAETGSISGYVISRSNISDDRLRIYPTNAAAVDEARLGHGLAIVPRFAVAALLANGSLVALDLPTARTTATWTSFVVAEGCRPHALTLAQMVKSPTARHEMQAYGGSRLRQFRPQINETRWS